MQCPNCGNNVPDNMKFCTNCGNQLQQINEVNQGMQGQNIPNQGAPNSMPYQGMQGQGVPQNQGMQGQNYYNPNMQPTQPAQKSGSGNKGLIIAVICIGVVLVAALLVLFLVIKPFGDNGDSAPAGTQVEATADPQNAGTDQGDATPEPESEVGMEEYKKYAAEADTQFEQLILTAEEKGQYSAYKSALDNAVNSNDEEQAKFNYDKLQEMEKTAAYSSEKIVAASASALKSWEKKKACKSAKNKTAYIKLKAGADVDAQNKKYSDANKAYKKCLKKLKAAKKKYDKKKKKKKKKKKTDDSMYRDTGSDNYTYDYVTSCYLTREDVSSLSAEMRRYYINTLFAAYGYRFTNKTIQSFFNRQSWYSADYSINEGDQTAIINWIKDYDVAYSNYKMLTGQ